MEFLDPTLLQLINGKGGLVALGFITIYFKLFITSRRYDSITCDYDKKFERLENEMRQLDRRHQEALRISANAMKENALSFRDLKEQLSLQAQSLKLINKSLEKIIAKLDGTLL